MRQIIKLIAIIISLSFLACDGMDEHYKDFLDGGPIIYISRLDNIVTHSGDKRVQISWDKPIDPRSETVKIYWANKTDSVVFKIAENPTQIIIFPLEEASYVFEIFVFDKNGNTSIIDIVPGDVYGDVFQKNLLNRKVLSTKKTGNSLKVTFAKFSDTRYQGSEIYYTNTDGQQSVTYFENAYIPDPDDPKKQIQVTEFTIEDYQDGDLEYKAVFLPNKDAFDLFYCTPDVVGVN